MKCTWANFFKCFNVIGTVAFNDNFVNVSFSKF